MKLSETNIEKTLTNLKEVKSKAVKLLLEMGYHVDTDLDNLILFKIDSTLVIRNPLLGQEYKLPIGYLTDKDGDHENEYTRQKEMQDKMNLKRIEYSLKKKR